MAPPTLPKHTKRWVLGDRKGFESLKYQEQVPIADLADHEVLVKMHAASLNYRDLVIAKGKYPTDDRDDVVPGSDGAGEVIAVGSKVVRFKTGDKVLTLFSQAHIGGPPTPETATSGLGGYREGVLRSYAAFPEHGLVIMPANLSYEEGATLPCAALTAWNALYGLRRLQPGETVLTQGTGGVSIFALQFAKAAGARVISTTSSKEKADRLTQLGADHVINYTETQSWGEEAKKLSVGGVGVDHIIEVGGPNTYRQSLDAVKLDGIITVIGFLGGMKADNEPSSLEVLPKQCIVRGLLVGSRAQFEDMNRAIEVNNIKPVVDKKIFRLADLVEAYQYQWDRRHFSKVVIKVD